MAWVRRVVPWLVAAGLLAYVFSTVPLGRVLSEIRRVGLVSVFVFSVLYFVYSYAADIFATWATFRWFCAPLSLRDVTIIRGATYLLAMVNYNLGQGGIIFMVGRQKGVGMAKATGTVLLTMGVMFVALLILAGVGSFLGDGSDTRLRIVRMITALGLGAFLVYLGIVGLRPAFLARQPLLAPLFDAGIGGTFRAFLVRFPHVAGHVMFQWILLRMFGVDIPFTAGATLLPVIFVIGWIPVTVQGLGTQQVAAMELLGPYAASGTLDERHAQVVAFSLTVSAMFMVYSLITGLVCLRPAARLMRPSPSDEGENAQPPASGSA